ncbi:thiol:disulfide interchange protein DsbC precursor [Burkholderia sola]|nr:DsbC family protein [Burkholderia sp. LAS2]RQU44221.1 DsbC family protein [Burkholderia cenocepacia]QVN14346.1 DsbC family protein [Burkholderia sp. LAS2]RQU88634.1 DsbC family protein [Burkholderia cenocepacia]RQV56363.1 DsbC family protein [Burkholderia cenocepacia]RQV86060.1 DsbC family protein [Burkholderia cenocepacia]
MTKRTLLQLTVLASLLASLPSILNAAPAPASHGAPAASSGAIALPSGTRIAERDTGRVLASMARDHAIKTVRGNGKRTLYVFSDPDCSHCKRLERTLERIDNVTIHTFLYPLEGLHPQAAVHARGVWCANDRNAAWKAWMIDNAQPAAGTCAAPLAQIRSLGLALGLRGTPTLFNANGRMMSGAVSAPAIETLLND